MATERKQIRVYIEKITIFFVRTTYRSARDYPFVLSLVLFMLILYRTSPLIFSLLVSSSPVIICTTILLGLLLSYGEPDIPDIESTCDKKNPEVSSLKVGPNVNDVYVENDEQFIVENHVKTKAPREDTIAQETFLGEENVMFVSKSEEEIIRTTTLSDKLNVKELDDLEKMIQRREIQSPDTMEDREIFIEKKGEDREEELTEDELSSSVRNKEQESLGTDIDKAEQVHKFDSSLDLPWQHVGNNVDFSDSESDGGESSSPDASMADIIPMLDELSPLLVAEYPQDAHLSRDDSDGASQGSLQDHDLDEESVEGEAEDNEVEKEVQEEKDNDAEVAVKWTEDDQKNVMDLGSSEIERNRRLESLIARRRARRNLTFAMERNLTNMNPNEPFASKDDLLHFPAHVQPIFAPRHNPFDLSFEQEETLMPGSAPSSLLPRRNPFDILDDQQTEAGSSEQEPWGQEDFASAQHQDMWFKRNETYSLDKRELGHVRRSSRLRPYFVPERMNLEEGSSSAFERQFSGKSDSKVSSVPESDTVTSVTDHDYGKELVEEELRHGAELASLGEHDMAPMDQIIQSSDEIESFIVELKRGGDDASGEHELNLGSHVISQDIHHDVEGFDSVRDENREEIYFTSTEPYSEKFELVDDQYNEQNSPSLSEEGEMVLPTTFREHSADLHLELDNRESVLAESVKVLEPIYDCSPLANSRVSSLAEASEDAGHATSLDSGLQVDISTNVSLAPSACKEIFEKSWQSSEVTHENLVEDEVSSIQEDSKHYISSSSLEIAAGDEMVEYATPFSTALPSTDTTGKTEASNLSLLDLSAQRNEDSERPEPKFKDIISTSLSTSKSELMVLVSGELSELKDYATTADQGNQVADHIQNLNSSDEESEDIHPVVFEHKDIDETLLSELDAVGDFHTAGLRPNEQSSELDLLTLSQGEESTGGSSSLDSHDYPPVPQAFLDKHHEVHSVASQIGVSETEYNYSFQSSDVDFERTVYNPKVRILQVKPDEEDDDSLSDELLEPAMPLSFSESDLEKLAQHGSNQSSRSDLAKRYLERTPTVSELPSLEEVSSEVTCYVEKIGEEYEENERIVSEDGTKSKSNLLIVEESTLDDIHAAFTELANAKAASTAANIHLEPGVLEMQHINENRYLSLKSKGETCSKLEGHGQNQQIPVVQSDLLVVEAKTLEEIHAAFRELSYTNSKEASSATDEVLESETSEKRLETEILELQPTNKNNLLSAEPQGLASSKLEELHVIEATSLDDIHMVFKELSGTKSEEVEGVANGLLELQSSELLLEPHVSVVHHAELNSLHSMEEVGESSSKAEQIKQDRESMEMHSNLHVIEAASLDDLHVVFKELSDFNSKKTSEEPIRQHFGLTGMHSDLHVVEAASLDDIHAALKEFSHVNTEKGAVQIRQYPESVEINPGLPVVEATSLDDIHAVFKGLSHANVNKATEEQIGHYPNSTEMHSDLHVLEATSLDDINAVFKELSDANIKNTAVETVELEQKACGIQLESELLQVQPDEKMLPKAAEQIRHCPESTEICSDMHVVEATSHDNIHAVFKELSDANVIKTAVETDELEQKAHENLLEAELLQVQPHEEVSVLPTVAMEASSQSEYDGDDISSSSLKIAIKKKSRKSKSRSNSRSSSSSSSSSSDSD